MPGQFAGTICRASAIGELHDRRKEARYSNDIHRFRSIHGDDSLGFSRGVLLVGESLCGEQCTGPVPSTSAFPGNSDIVCSGNLTFCDRVTMNVIERNQCTVDTIRKCICSFYPYSCRARNPTCHSDWTSRTLHTPKDKIGVKITSRTFHITKSHR